MLPLPALSPIEGGLFLGWTLGANDSANVFGTAVASRIISFRQASILCGIAVILGSFFQGAAGIHTLSGLTTTSTLTLKRKAIQQLSFKAIVLQLAFEISEFIVN